jgi:uncharacterized protein YdeI (YjbR/CyaY-like superfamily)
MINLFGYVLESDLQKMIKIDEEAFCPENREAWRKWLQANHQLKKSVWLIYNKKHTGLRGLSWAEAVEEALCFGWIDGRAKPIDENQYQQFFTQRKSGSVWSKINKDKILDLTAAGLMAPAGTAAVELARNNGSWSKLDAVEALEIPPDLAKELKEFPAAGLYYSQLSKSVKKILLTWVMMARKPETRQNRIREIVQSAAVLRLPKVAQLKK